MQKLGVLILIIILGSCYENGSSTDAMTSTNLELELKAKIIDDIGYNNGLYIIISLKNEGKCLSESLKHRIVSEVSSANFSKLIYLAYPTDNCTSCWNDLLSRLNKTIVELDQPVVGLL